MNNEQSSINKVNIETQNTPEKGPLSFLTGSLTSFLLCIFSYFISNKIAIYFSLHKPSNSSEIVQSISSSINTLIIGLSFFCLLYTSPSPRDATLSRMPSSA